MNKGDFFGGILVGGLFSLIGGMAIGDCCGKYDTKPREVYVTKLNEDSKSDVVIKSIRETSIWLSQENGLHKKLEDVEEEMRENAVEGVEDYINGIKGKVGLKYPKEKEPEEKQKSEDNPFML